MSGEGLGLGPTERLRTKATPPAEQRRWGEGSCQAGGPPAPWGEHSSLGLLAKEEAEPWASHGSPSGPHPVPRVSSNLTGSERSMDSISASLSGS